MAVNLQSELVVIAHFIFQIDIKVHYMTPTKQGPEKKDNRGVLIAIAIFRLIKGTLLLIVGVGALSLVGKDVNGIVSEWLDDVHFDAATRHLDTLIVKLGLMSGKQLKLLGAGAFIYAALFLTEGTGLLLKKRWAEYFTALITASFIPFELYELIHKFTAIKLILIVSNVAIFVYIVFRIRKEKRTKQNGEAQKP